ncbi:Zinc finger protein PLAG1 [Eumeta japonica]|uniref:Zinc finger protein PLAG1 n=1 Tax=Eumeta variegata TaxID=151549 RepID=A0A4C1WA66_EUMVA|nr:Zinc finger protein PLAG1 [Eumeta japonica]
MASPSSNPREGEEGGSELPEESGEHAPPAQKTYVAPPTAQLPTKLQFVALGAPGPSGIKQCFRTVKAARRVPTLPRRPDPPAPPDPPDPPPERRGRRDRSKRYACATCDKRFSSPGKLSQHQLAHTGELPFSCEFCDKRFNSKFKLVRHALIHSEARAFACTHCGKTFNRKDHLNNHARVHNPVKKLYTCEKADCRKSYTSLMSYRKHAALHSAEEGNLQCKICGENFTTRQDIVYHLKVHTGSRTVKNETDKKFTCNFCDRRFFTAKDVRRHLVVHTGRRDFLCPFCPQKFGRKDHLVRHVKNAHPDESWRSAAVGTSSEPPLSEPPEPEPKSEEGFLEFELEPADFGIWKREPVEEGSETEMAGPSGRTRVPSSDIIVEIPPIDVKVEPHDVKLEEGEGASPGELLPVDYPVVYVVPPDYGAPSPATDLPYLGGVSDAPLPLLDEANVQSLLLEAGDLTLPEPAGPSSGSGPTPPGQQSRVPLPAFTQAFQTAQSPKPPPPPPPPH